MLGLFVAVVPPADIIDRLTDVQWGLSRARWSTPDQLHLRFIGPVRDQEVPSLAAVLADLAASTPPLPLWLQGMGHFPPRGSARSLWAGVRAEDDLVALRGLRAGIDRAFCKVGLPADARKFAPHVTLARLSRRAEVPDDAVAGWLAGRGLFKTPAGLNHVRTSSLAHGSPFSSFWGARRARPSPINRASPPPAGPARLPVVGSPSCAELATFGLVPRRPST